MGKENMKSISPFARLMHFAAPHKRGFIKSVILAVTGVVCGVFPYFIAANMIVALIDGNRDIGFYALWCGVAAVSFIIKSVTASLSTSTSHEATFSVLSTVRRTLCAKFARLPMGFVLQSPSGQLKSSVVERVEQLEIPLAHMIPELSADLLVPLVIVAYLFVLDWRMALSALAVFALAILCYLMMMRTYPKRYGEVVAAGKHMSATTVEYINGIEVIKAFNQSEDSYKKFSDAVRRNTDTILDWAKSTQSYSAVMMCLMPAVLLFVLPVGILCHAGGSLSTSELIICVMLSLGIIEPLAAAVFLTDDVAKIGTMMNEFGAILDAEEMHRPELPAKIEYFDISLKNVCFGYGEKEVLHDVSLEIKEGETTALVGASGSGKSTIARLIASLWDVTSGSVQIGGVDIRKIPMEQLADIVSYVSQDNYLFNDTVRNNIRMGRPGATDKQVEEAAKASGCHAFIMSLPNGYETICGGAGGELSGGERQRITIARAMMKNAPIVILDEATSYTDPENEAVIQKAIGNLTKGKTLIVIAHRLSTITNFEQIVVVDQGGVLAAERHDELLKSCAHYRSMWNAHIGPKEVC